MITIYIPYAVITLSVHIIRILTILIVKTGENEKQIVYKVNHICDNYTPSQFNHLKAVNLH